MIKKLATIGAVAALLATSAFPALAVGPSENPSCLGHEAAAISPPGSSELGHIANN